MSYPPLERWRSRTTFIFALSLAALGLGNIWRFAFLMGENGGAPFFLSYLLCLLLVGAPVLVAELVLGRHGRGSPLLTLRWAVGAADRSRVWLLLVLPACAAGFMLLVVALAIAGWALFYAYQQQLGEFAAISLPESAAFFAGQIAHPNDVFKWQFLVAALVALVISAGVRRGIGVVAWIALPLIMTLFTVLIAYAVEFGDLAAAGAYLFAWQPLDFDGGSFMAALTHAIFTLTLGVAVGMTYGAYAPSKLPIVRSVLAVVLFDLVMAVACGIAVYPLVFSSNLQPGEGFALLFIAMPYVYGNAPFGDLYGALFFVAIFVTALGSAVALLEPLVAVLAQQFDLKRPRITVILCIAAALLSALATHELHLIAPGEGILALFDALSAHWMIPLGVLLLAVFVGWRMPRALLRQELSREPDILFRLWYFLLRFLAPPAIAMAWLWLLLVR